jgi:hypothetical protein
MLARQGERPRYTLRSNVTALSDSGWSPCGGKSHIATCLIANILHSCLVTLLASCEAKVVPVLNWLSTIPWRYIHMGDWRYSSTILDLGTRRTWVVSFTPRPLYPGGNRPRHRPDRRLGGPQSRSGRCGEECSCGCSHLWADYLENLVASTSNNPMGLRGLLQG